MQKRFARGVWAELSIFKCHLDSILWLRHKYLLIAEIQVGTLSPSVPSVSENLL